ncbi:MAG: sulfate reduction electron transfer complex DsrMKJOP subunit DsrM [Bilophila wadsworthia]
MIVSLVAVLLIGAIAWSGAVAGFQSLLGVALPLLAAVVFVCGIIWRITCWWAKSPVPFAIPTTGGQERSLDWIKPNRLDTPMSNAAVVGRMILEVLLFRSLFRNTSAEVSSVGPRVTYFSSKWLWVFALTFHYCFLVIFIRHFRFFIEPVPVCLTWLEFFDGIMQVGVPRLFMTDMLIVVAVLFSSAVAWRTRKCATSPRQRLFPAVPHHGHHRHRHLYACTDKVDIAQAKVFIMGILHFTPQSAVGLNPLFFTHVALVSVLLIYFPFSKLMHMGGIFMSPTRNMRCNTREVRHVNPWNNPNAPYRTYAEYEDDFRDLMAEAGLPLEKQPEDVEPAAPAPSK